MKKQLASMCVVMTMVVVAAAQPVGASNSRSIGPQNQFHIQPKKGRSAQFDRIQNRLAEAAESRDKKMAKMGILKPTNAKTQVAAGKLKPRRNTTGTGSVGFVAASQIAAGGSVSANPGLAGDFNGDGKKDLLTVVCNSSCVLSIAASLGNGDGTFQTPALTTIPAGSSDAFVVGDLNGDGKDDVIVVHRAGSLGSGTPSSFDVFLSNGDGTFTVGNNFVITSNDLAGGLLYDINGDGKLDVVVLDSAQAPAGSMWTMLGNGDGTFQPATAIALNGQAGSSVVFGDFNGDGLLDFADNDYTTGQLTVYLATSATQFAAPVSYTTSNGIYDGCANAAGDLTGDGKPEIVTANCDDDTVTVYTNDGTGNFSTGVYFPVAVAPSAGSTPYVLPYDLTIADVNGDGKGDVVSVNYESGDVTVLLGNGDGTVQTPSVGYATGGYPVTRAVVADFNGDGLPDVVVTDYLYSFVYMKGFGDGTFQAAVDYYSPSSDNGEPYAWDLATGDFNGDGFPDVVIGNCCDSGVGITVFLSNGDGTLQPGVNYGTGGELAYLTVADFNKDGIPDIAAVDYTSGMVQIFTGVGDGTFTAGAILSTSDSDSQKIAAADLNGDGYPDLVVANGSGSNVGVFLNDGHGNFGLQTPYSLYYSPSDVVIADVNGDGKLDLLMAEPEGGNLAVLLGNGDGTFQTTENDYTLGNYPEMLAIGDLNGDGKLDVAATIDDNSLMGIAVALGNGDGTFQAANNPAYPSTMQNNALNPYPTFIQMTDLNGDGYQDVVYTNSNFGTVGVMFGNAQGTLSNPVEYPSGEWAAGIALADVNGDGALDVVTAGDDTSEVTVLINNTGSKALPNYSVSANTTSATVTPGQTATITFTLTPRNFYNGTVTFSCSGLPAESQCVFSNPTLTPNGNALMTTTLTLQTTAPSTAMLTPNSTNGTPWSGGTGLLASLSTLGTFGLMLAGNWKKQNGRRIAIVLGAMALGLVMVTVGCGGNYSTVQPTQDAGTPAGNYTVTVTAAGTAGSNNGNTSAHPVTVNLTVQ